MIGSVFNTARIGVQMALADIGAALRQFRNACFLALTGMRLRYRRSFLGPLWIPITSSIFVFSISYLYSGLFASTSYPNYLLSLALGWIIWQFINDSVVQGCQTFQQGANIIQSTNIPLFMFVLKTLGSNLFALALNFPVAILAFAISGTPFSRATWLVIPGLVLIILSGAWVCMLFGMLCAWQRDLSPMVQAAMRILFFLTPVIWLPEFVPTGSLRGLFVDLNPLSHYVAIWRMPLMGQFPEPLSWIVTVACTVVGLMVAFALFARYRREIVFWV